MNVSYSQLRTYRTCPKQYEFMSVKKIPRRISAGESFGSSVHNTLRRFGELEMASGATPPLKRQLTLFTDETPRTQKQQLELTTLLTLWRECFIAEGYATRADRDACVGKGDKLLTRYFEWWKAKPRTVMTVESGFKLEIPGHAAEGRPLTLAGRFDRIERTRMGLHVIDYKTGSPQEQADVDADLQLSIYALAAANEWKEPVSKLTLLFLGPDGLVERTTERNETQLKEAVTVIRSLGGGITGERFEATPNARICSYCPYRDICPFRAA